MNQAGHSVCNFPLYVAYAHTAKAALFLGILLFMPAAAQDVYLEASTTGMQKMNIAILRMVSRGKVQKRRPHTMPDGVLENDLLLSGRFNVTRTDHFDSTKFAGKKIPIYVDGSYTFEEGNMILSFALYDCKTKDLLLGKKYTSQEKNLRRMVHKFADEIVMALFGEKGIAQTRIVFVKRFGPDKEIYVMDYDGHNQKKITNSKTLNLFPSWSPDNKEVVYVSYQKGRPNLYIADVTTKQSRPFLTKNGLSSSPDWSIIENLVIFASSVNANTEIFVADVAGGLPVRLTHHWAIDTSPTWSPNGYEIAFTSDRKGNPQIFIMDKDGADVRRLTFEGKYNDSPSWSPRGDKMAYASLEGNSFNIYTITVDGEAVQKLTNGPGSNEYPSWSPDGRHLTFTRKMGRRTDIFVMNEDGSEQRQITFSGNCVTPSWSNF